MSDDSHTINKAFSTYQKSNDLSGQLAEIVKILAEDSIQNPKLRALIPPREENEYSIIQAGLLDLVLFYITSCLEDHYLTSEESSNVLLLKMVFRVQEEDFYTNKLVELQRILSAQISIILSDHSVNPSEALQQVELQRCFGISYDQFLQITKPYIDEIINKFIGQIPSEGAVTKPEREMLTQKILNLGTVYFLNSDQKKILDELT
jgi:hypothetical protein